MSDAPPADTPAAPKSKKNRRTWRQRFRILILTVLIGAALARVSLNFLLPTVINRVAGMYDLEVGYDSLSLSLLGGTAQIWGLKVRPAGGADSLLQTDFILGHISPLDLFRGRLVAYRADVDGAVVAIDRDAQGRFPAIDKVLAASAKPAQPASTQPAKPMSLDAPLRVDAVRLSHVTVRLRDRSVTPAFEAAVHATVRVDDVGQGGAPTRFELDVGIDPLLDTVRITGEARTAPDHLQADAKILVRGLHPKAAAGYLALLGLKPVADDMTVQAGLSLVAKTIPNSADFAADVRLTDVTAVADGAEWAALKSLHLDATRLSPAVAEIASLTIEGGLATASRTADGTVHVAGIAPDPAAVARPKPPATRATNVAVTAGPPFKLSLGTLDVRDCQAKLTDAAVTPAAEWVAKLESLSLKGIDTSADAPVPLELTASLPGVVRRASVRGKVKPFAAEKSVDLAITADGIRPDLLRPYLERVGVHSLLNDAQFAADVTATFTADATGLAASVAATGMKLADGNSSLIEMNAAVIDHATYAAADGAIGVKAIDLSGPVLKLARDADGHPVAVGFKYVPPTNVDPRPIAPATQARSTVPGDPQAAASTTRLGVDSDSPPRPFAGLPRVRVGRFSWRDMRLTLEDRMPMTAGSFDIQTAGVDVENFLLDLNATSAEQGGKFVAWFASPGLADSFTASGSFAPGPGRLTVTAEVEGDGLTGAKVAPYLQSLGIVPTLKAGKLAAKASGTLTQSPAGVGVDLEAHDVTFADGGTELTGVDFAGVNGLAVSATRIDADSVAVIKPRVRVARQADGTFAALGIHLVPVAAPPAARPPQPVQPAEPPLLALPAKLPIDVGVKALRVVESSIDWTDAAAARPVAVHAVGSVMLDNVDTATGGPATLSATARVDHVVGNATVKGTLGVSPASPFAKLTVTADGLMTPEGDAVVAAYLPPTLATTVRGGRFAASSEISVSNNAVGGLAARVGVSGLDFADGSGSPLAKVGGFTLDVRRADPAAGVYDVAELSSSGVEAAVRRTPAGLEAMGVRVVAAPPPTSNAPATQPAAAPTTAPVASLAAMVGDARKPLPTLTVGKLDLGLSRLTLAGFTGENAADVVVRDARLSAPAAFTLGGADAENLPPLKFDAEAGIDPVVGRIAAVLTATPFATEPAVSADVAVTGIRGDGLTKLLPALAARLDGSELKDGTFHTYAEASFNYGRKGPRDFGLARGFTASFDVKPAEMRAEPNGPVLAGVQLVHGEGIHIEPARGNVAVKLIEVSTPVARAVRDDRGLHAAGLTLLLGKDESAETITTPKPAEPAKPGAAPPAPPPAERPANEIRLDRFTVTGADVVLEDHTGKPFTVVPIKGLDVDVQGLSNQLPWNGKAVRFSVLCTSDKVAMPPRKGAKGQATTNVADGKEYTEQRELFSQVTASGKVGFARQGDAVTLDGWTKTAVNGFEILGVRGLARQYGVTVGGGSFDDTNDVRFNPAGLIETKNKIVFTNLSLSEPENGPLRKLLKLPAPIDVAIGAVTDPDGSITMNLPVPIKNGAIHPGDVVGPALGAVANVLITGIASAPVKAVAGVGNLFGLGGNKDVAPEPPVEITFLPAYAGLGGEASERVRRLADELRKDETLELQLKSTLTDADVARSAVRANPPRETALQLAAQLRRQKADLLSRYATLSARARGGFGAQANAIAARTADELRDTGRQIAQAEQSLDDLYALTTPGASAQTERRTKAAALQTAHDRLDAVKAALANLVPAADTRVHPTNPPFDPVPSDGGGTVTVILVRKKH